MSHVRYVPAGGKRCVDITTTMDKVSQIWQELTMLRHEGADGIYGKKVTSSYIDQAKTYYLDARNSNWKSGGLLYYYSFLNLAKAFVVSQRAISGSKLKSTSIYHGLTNEPQNPSNLSEFEFQIHPKSHRNKKNIFAVFYEKLTDNPWPFNSPLTIKIKDIISYCDEISHEFDTFYAIQGKNFLIQSIVRLLNNEMWLELLAPNRAIPILQSSLGTSVGIITDFPQMTQNDKDEWITAYNRKPTSLRNHSLVRINQKPFNQTNQAIQFQNLQDEVNILFKDYYLPMPAADETTARTIFWIFVPKVTLNNQELVWHPLLSNYLIAFVLSSILRYNPHLFLMGSKDSFIAEAWCNQSPITSIRYFLMALSRKNLRLN